MSEYRGITERTDPIYEKFDVDLKSTKKVIDGAKADDRFAIGDAEAWDILKAYGLKIPKSYLAKTADEAVKLAADLGFPVVMKIASPDILHKTDVGGVKGGIGVRRRGPGRV